ncbi:MAG: inorganic pyrophosphatase [Bacteroidia bacterium]|nr:inorganic pyrophosphatase [Bacteroidia bacterium]
MQNKLFKPHPWHGIEPGKNSPEIVTAFIEIVPTDTVKYEIDKESGYLKVDRLQKYSNLVPALYGFIPKTYCGKTIATFAAQKTKRTKMKGDGDPLDILVLTEKNISHGDIILEAIPIGGFRMIDKGEADDKIIAVFSKDEFYTQWKSINDVPRQIVDRLKHYFLTYKNLPGDKKPTCEITHVYDRKEAQQVIKLALDDYRNEIEGK